MKNIAIYTQKGMIIRILLLVFGELTLSTAVIMLKASNEHPFLVAAFRLLIASVVLSPLFFRAVKTSKMPFGWQQIGWSALPAVALAFHFISWVYAARMTPVANASLLVNLSPVALPFFLWLFYRERITKTELIGTIIALCGIVLLSGMDFVFDRNVFLGEVITIISMLGLACYIALGRKNSSRINLWLYLVPMYFMAGLMCFCAALFFINPLKIYSSTNILLIFGLAFIPTVTGHSIMNYSLKFFRGQVIGIANLLQPIFAGVMGFIIFKEIPSSRLYIAAVFVVIGIIVVIRGNSVDE